MALPKLYDRIIWHNDTEPALNEDNLNAMSKGLDDVDDRLIVLAGTIMEDVPEIQHDLEILEPAIENIDANVERAETAADNAEEDALKSEGFAVGTQDGVEVTSGEYYQNNAKYYAEIANPPIENTVDFTDIITISDAINKAAKDVRLKVEAVQDLHGYNNPWVGGAGKNKLNMASSVVVPSGSNWLDAKPIVLTAGTYTFSCKSTATSGVSSFEVYASDNTKLYEGAISWGATSTLTFTISGTSAYMYAWTATATTLTELQIESGSQKTAYEPYENICPISGWDNAKVTRGGKNFYINSPSFEDYANSGTWTLSAEKYNGHEVRYKREAWGGMFYRVPVKAGKTYTFSAMVKVSEAARVYIFHVNNASLGSFDLSANTWTKVSATITPSADINEELRAETNSNTATIYVSEYQLELGSTATEYEPYKETEELTISLNGIRYGGTLDVTSGVLTLDKGYQDMGDLSWTYYSQTQTFYTMGLASLIKPPSSTSVVANAICSHYPIVAANQVPSKDKVLAFETNGQFNAKDTNYTVAATFKTAMSGVQLVYELAIPQTIQLTPTQVYLLYGYNTLFGDCGDISLTYDASGIIHIDEAKLDTETLKTIAAASSDFADFKARIAAL